MKKFPANSFLTWLEIAERAGVPSVPATRIGRITIDDIEAIDAGDHPSIDVVDLMNRAVEAEAAGNMIRADCCSSEDLKHSMAMGRYPERASFDICERLLTLIGDDGNHYTDVASRPWRDDLMTAAGSEGGTYPVEWRVFFGGDADDAAVSAYYPQAPLDSSHKPFADAARQFALRIIQQAIADELMPWMPIYSSTVGLAPDRFHCSLDFVTTAGGEVLFLEGGPAHFKRWGAHPCCFEGKRPSGLALRKIET